MSRPALERLLAVWSEVEDLGHAQSVLSWDQETQMPAGAHVPRGKALATLAGLAHAKLTAPETLAALEAAERELEERAEDPEEHAVAAAELREARRHVDRLTRVPEALVRAKAEARAEGHARWIAAREARDFAPFRDSLATLVRLTREEAEAIGAGEKPPYDVLLDGFEPGATEAELEPLFERLTAELAPLVEAAAASGRAVDDAPVRGEFPADDQLALGRELSEAIGFDFSRGRIDRSAHPFCSGFAPSDVRITWRYSEDDLRPALFGILHESGHGLYEQGLPAAWQRTPIGGAVSLGVHESQSRLWENLVARSRGFWRWALPRLRERFPAHPPVDEEALHRALNTIRPSLIRVEADEGTYDLHVLVRFELERALFAGRIDVDELPEAWDAMYAERLGVRAPDAHDGVLQDVHWSMGAFGYFPTYTLGNLIAAQLFEAAERDLGDLEEAFAKGEFQPLLGWLRERVHAHGSRYPAAELVARATGAPLAPDAYLRRRRAIAADVYGVGASAG